MFHTKKYSLVIIIILCICSIHTIAQTDFYYYKGEKIPLKENENKVCLSIPKDKDNLFEIIQANVKVQDKLNDDIFDVLIIDCQDVEKLSSMDCWEKFSNNVLLTPCYNTANDQELYSTPYLNVRLKKESDLPLLESYAKRYGLKIVRQDPLMPLWYILSITDYHEINTLECANIIYESGVFAESIPDLSSKDMHCSNDPLFDMQWGLHNNNYPDIDISVSPAWNYATGKNVKIAIIDTGVDMDHIDLASNISDLSFDTETSTSPSVVYYSHATHCAGIAAAVKDNSVQIAGVAPEATIVSISNTLGSSCNMQLKLADGIVWAYQHGVDIISNSWYSSSSHPAIDESIHEAFKYGRQGKGCVIVFSSGNNYSNMASYPANCNDTIIVVGAINESGVRANFSNYGMELDVVAPGVNILSTLPNDQVGYDDGTSMACPHVAGVAALILERNPNLTVMQVKKAINRNAKKISYVDFNVIQPDGLWNFEYGYGLVDAYNSVVNTPSVVFIQNDTITGTQTIISDTIYIGRDVTDRLEYGDVILGQGNITINTKKAVIKNSTTVPLGTYLEIETP